tara:strand:- start:409 stop:654 length:246 start_codon:yes stop_codon:yes gene_type:complete
MESQFRFDWHGLDFAVKVTHTRSAAEMTVHQTLVLEARWKDDGTWIADADLTLILRFVAEAWPTVVKQALGRHLLGLETST